MASYEEQAMLQAGDSLFTIEESGCLEVHCYLKVNEMTWTWGALRW
ncbi:MAG: hypothetical protein P1U77_09985 [Rubripirellula sp.]|nr:hypothetical protein [Planctomycetaceae bacterium]MDF1841755.1 hypothetical protein [Rubripirellula sp.]